MISRCAVLRRVAGATAPGGWWPALLRWLEIVVVAAFTYLAFR